MSLRVLTRLRPGSIISPTNLIMRWLRMSAAGIVFICLPKTAVSRAGVTTSLPWDRPGKYVYVRDANSGEYWSLSWQPVPKNLDFYECRHGLGYSTITTKYLDIKGQITYFIPLQDDLEIWKITLTNEGKETKKLQLFSFVELCLGHALVDLINQPNDQHFNEVHFIKEDNSLYATKRYWVTYSDLTVKQANQAWNKWVFFSSSLPIVGFDGNKNKFIGKWRSEQNPVSIEEGKSFNTEITAGDAVGVIQNEITLAPGETESFSIVLGVVDKLEEDILPTGVKGKLTPTSYRGRSRKLVEYYSKISHVENELSNLKDHWKKYLSFAHVKTPDPTFNLMMNVWNQYQNKMTFTFSRNASYHHGGLLFGRGYRDSCQDMLGPVMIEPDSVRQRILEMGKHQFKNGSVMHCYYPLTGGGERTGHSDTPLWFPLACCQYIKKTGDYSILTEILSYQDNGNATVLQHLLGNIDYVIKECTPRGLPKFGPGDWNDTLDYLGREGKGESVWVALFLAYTIKETIELLKNIESQISKSQIDLYESQYKKLSGTINSFCWDGKWYLRGPNDWGENIGSHKCEEGKIFSNAQSWAVISGVAQNERAIQCMDSVKEHLDTPKGPKILHPAYTKVNPRIGLATRCVPGKKENGAVFNHPVTWTILAECLLGRGDQAYEYYRKALPPALQSSLSIIPSPSGRGIKGEGNNGFDISDEDLYEVEPYVYAEYVTSPDHPTMGQASHSWLTGTAAWMLHDGLSFILGVRAEYNGLRIDPCIPKHWNEFSFTRVFRGVTYNIHVQNPNHVNHGVKCVKVNGDCINSNLLPLFPKGSKHQVEVVLGK